MDLTEINPRKAGGHDPTGEESNLSGCSKHHKEALMGKGVKRSRHHLKEKPSFRFFPVFGNVQHGNLASCLKLP